jgi:dCMP deaminase|tara:strand:- start:200 stop:658 length:459 start_codon:yes stop_codon:yes gene_type:complete
MKSLKQNCWDIRFMRMAHEVASWSKDPSTKVGCVLVKDRKIISMGYNGFPRLIEDDLNRLIDREVKYEMTVHAEQNAVITAALHGISTAGSTAYVTFSPCSRCAAVLINAGISTVVVSAADDIPSRWLKNFQLAAELLNEAGIGHEIIDPEL